MKFSNFPVAPQVSPKVYSNLRKKTQISFLAITVQEYAIFLTSTVK